MEQRLASSGRTRTGRVGQGFGRRAGTVHFPVTTIRGPLSRAGRAGVDAGLHNNLLRIVWCAVRRHVVTSSRRTVAVPRGQKKRGRMAA